MRLRVVLADDSGLLREALQRLLVESGVTVLASVGDGVALQTAVAEHQPDVAIVDIRMPPTFTTEGIETAVQLRQAWPRLGILLLSQAVESRAALDLARAHPSHFGYLLKDRVVNVATLIDALERIHQGGTVLDPGVVLQVLQRQAGRERFAELSERERDVLALMAEGRSNRAVARELSVGEKTVETHIASIFSKLDLRPERDDHRRVLAVRAWLSQ